jgi:hypothetical protein
MKSEQNKDVNTSVKQSNRLLHRVGYTIFINIYIIMYTICTNITQIARRLEQKDSADLSTGYIRKRSDFPIPESGTSRCRNRHREERDGT